MRPLHIQTPVFHSKLLSNITDKNILLKMECYQPIGSFKIRGIGRLCQEYVAAGQTHLISSSGGNAGYAVAYAGKKLGVQVTVFVPKPTHPMILNFLNLEGADVRIEGEIWDDAHEAAMKFVDKHKGAYIPPFDHPTIWAGHSTMIDEIVQQCEKPDVIIASVGGGGLMCGILEGLQKNDWLDVSTFSVETEGAASFAKSIRAGKLITLDKIDTIAKTLAAKRVTKQLFEWSKRRTITPLVVSDQASALACRKFADDHRVLVEPACGAALSTIYDIREFKELADVHTILVVVCGGIGISIDLLQQYMQLFDLI